MSPRSRLRSLLALVAALAAALPGPLLGASRLFIPEARLPEGSTNRPIEVLCDHDRPLLGFSLVLGYDPALLRVSAIQRGEAARDFEFFNGQHDVARGEIVFGGLLSQRPSAGEALPPGEGHSLLRLLCEPLGPEGTSTEVRFLPEKVIAAPLVKISNLLQVLIDADTLEEDGETPAAMVHGLVRVTPAGLFAEAGPDIWAGELETVTLDGSASSSQIGRQLSFRWRQLSGPPLAIEPAALAEPRLSFAVPLVIGDSPIELELEIGDGAGRAADTLRVTAVDLDLRQPKLSFAQPRSARRFEGGAKAALFEGAIEWSSIAEDGLWSRLRLTPAGDAEARARLQRLSLIADLDGDGEPDPSDETLAALAPVPAEGPLELQLSRILRDGSRLAFLVVGEIAEAPIAAAPRSGSRTLALALAALAALLAPLGRRRPFAALALFGLVAWLAAAAACGGGGGHGGSPPPAAPAAGLTLRLDLASPSDILLRGGSTLVRIPWSGAPVQGPTLEL